MLVEEAVEFDAVVTLRDDDGVPHAARVLLHHRIPSAPVLDGAGHLVGVVSESDLLRGRVARDPRAHLDPRDGADGADEVPARSVADVMTPHPVTVGVRDDLADALDVLLERGFRTVPVLEGHRLVAVLTRRDVLRTITRQDEDVQGAVRRLLVLDLPDQEWDVAVDDGVVTLNGAHDVASQRIAAILARTVPGVARVVSGEGPVSSDAPVHRARCEGLAPD